MKREEFAQLTGLAIETLLKDFPLPLAAPWTPGLLASRLSDGLATTIPSADFDPNRTRDVELRQTMNKLAGLLALLIPERQIFGSEVDKVLSRHSYKSEGFSNYIGFIYSSRTRYRKFHQWVSQLPEMSDFLRDSASSLERQAPKWRLREKRELRISRGEVLIAIFEAAFGTRATVNNWAKNGGDARHTRPTPFMVFYQSVVELAFGESATPDLPRILREARSGRRRLK